MVKYAVTQEVAVAFSTIMILLIATLPSAANKIIIIRIIIINKKQMTNVNI